MMQTMADRLRQEGEARGRAQGVAQGRVQGVAQGRAAMLLHQMTTRFGDVSDDMKAQVSAATVEQLDAWAVAIFEAKSAEDLLLHGRVG